ncbi:MAG: succinate dehydrogenase cytochrome b subunit [Planctomycetes bacterium]|nr:succinate dehydrogenase cytochrome b subunit [Planctomycetota bacterium]
MTRIFSFSRTNVGSKVVLAATGAVIFLFLIGHMLGNLQIFEGPERLNAYAALLKSTGKLLWGARIMLLVAVTLHIVTAAKVTLANWRARPVGYTCKKNIETSYAARTMIITGPLVFLYVAYHLMMFTLLKTGPEYSETDVYANVVAAFKMPVISGVYIVAMLILGAHLYHGIWSMLQTVGIGNSRYRRLRRTVAPAVAIVIAAGYIAIPVAVLAGIVK